MTSKTLLNFARLTMLETPSLFIKPVRRLSWLNFKTVGWYYDGTELVWYWFFVSGQRGWPVISQAPKSRPQTTGKPNFGSLASISTHHKLHSVNKNVSSSKQIPCLRIAFFSVPCTHLFLCLHFKQFICNCHCVKVYCLKQHLMNKIINNNCL